MERGWRGTFVPTRIEANPLGEARGEKRMTRVAARDDRPLSPHQ
jgi:hypothetical protein